jgi:quercetin dioxygenase-like cupin family protein
MSAVGPKQATRTSHKHSGDEKIFALEGTAQFYLDGHTTTGCPNTSFYCPKSCEHPKSAMSSTEIKYLMIRKYKDK